MFNELLHLKKKIIEFMFVSTFRRHLVIKSQLV